jgi:hypothetical protein
MMSADGTFAQDFPTKAELMQSAWEATYTAPDGEKIQAEIQFSGPGGSCTTSFGTGQLLEIQYGVDTQSNPAKPFFQITGKWSFQG